MKKYYLIYISVLILAFSCHSIEDSPPYPVFNNSYIQAFVEFDTVEAVGLGGIYANKENKTVRREIGGGSVLYYYPDRKSDVTNGVVLDIIPCSEKRRLIRNNEEYDKLIEKIEDTRCSLEHAEGWSNIPTAIVDTLSSIKIRCKEDFNEQFKAGDDISSLFFVFFEHPYLVVKNNYKKYRGEDGYRLLSINQEYPHAMVGASLPEMNFEDRPFIGDHWICQLLQAPDKTGLYSFEVEVIKTNGQVLKTISRPIGIKGLKD